MIRPFTIRHRKAIFEERRIVVRFRQKLNARVWMICERFDHSVGIQEDPFNSWITNSSVLAETEKNLKEIYGTDELVVNRGDEKVEVDLENYVKETYPSRVLDFVEVFWSHLAADPVTADFVTEINAAFQDEGAPWRLVSGQFFKVDSQFLEEEVLARSHQLLAAEGFEGALEEFREARNDLVAGDFKGTVHNAAKSYESVMKTILGTVGGNANVLTTRLVSEGILDDLRDGDRGGFRESVLMTLPFIRNRLGGHGQGESVQDVPRAYAELSLHLAAALNLFLVEKYVAGQRQEEPQKDTSDPFTEPDDDLPF